jgi:hypothetical protein
VKLPLGCAPDVPLQRLQAFLAMLGDGHGPGAELDWEFGGKVARRAGAEALAECLECRAGRAPRVVLANPRGAGDGMDEAVGGELHGDCGRPRAAHLQSMRDVLACRRLIAP